MLKKRPFSRGSSKRSQTRRAIPAFGHRFRDIAIVSSTYWCFHHHPPSRKHGCNLIGCRRAIVLLLHTFARQRFNVAMAIPPWKISIRLDLRMAHVRTHGGVIIPRNHLVCSILFYFSTWPQKRSTLAGFSSLGAIYGRHPASQQ